MTLPGAKLLLVDDEPAVLEGLRLVLRSEPFDVHCAESGASALELMARTQYAAVVSDERMPGMSGSELLAQVRRSYPSTARILLTGHASFDAAVRCINEARAARFLKKPCDGAEIRAAIADAIRTQAAETAAANLVAMVEQGLVAAPLALPAGLERPSTVGRFKTAELAMLSLREREVFDLIVAGQRTTQIARKLFISLHTVRNHLKAIFGKLGVHSQTELREKAGK